MNNVRQGNQSATALPTLQIEGITQIEEVVPVAESSWYGQIGETTNTSDTSSSILKAIKSSSEAMDKKSSRAKTATAVKDAVLRIAGVGQLSDLLAAI